MLALMDTPAAVPLHPTLVISILVSLTSLIPLLVTLLVMKVLVPILLSMGTRLKLQQYHFPLPVIIRLRSLQDKKKHFLSRERWQNNVANFMHITLRKSECPIPIAPSRIFVALW
jgi:hypothetical protein